jgi:hypothetical protein
MNREKLGERFAGPFKISWVGRRACTLEGLPTGYHPTFHVSLIEPYKRGPTAPPPIQLPPLSEGQQHFTPQAIIRYGVNDEGEISFLIQWKNCSISENTWETYNSLIPGSEKMLSEFYKANPKCPKNKAWKEPEEDQERSAGRARKRKDGPSKEQQGTRKSRRIC